MFSLTYRLFAADAVMNRKILAFALKKRNIPNVQAENGLEAVKYVQNYPNEFQVIFMDINMPEMVS